MGVTEKLAQFIVNTKFKDFDADVVRGSKELLFNGLGAMIIGANERVTQIAIKHVKDMGGVEEVGVIGARFRTSLTNAVFVGGISVHAVEQEACGRFPGGPPFPLIPVALALADKYNLPGKSAIEGFIVGHEIQGRLGIGSPGGSNRGWSGVYSPLGVVACTAKMINLNVDQTRMAIGIAADAIGGSWRHCGYMQHFAKGAATCRNGVTAALLAKEGITSDPDIIDGVGGFGDWVGEFDPDKVLQNLGSPFYTLSPGVSIKKYNCCFGMHRALEALWQLIWENGIVYDQIESVQVEVPKFVTRLIRYPEPQNGEQAKFSFEHAFAVLITDRLANQMTDARSFSDSGAVNPKYVEARKKVKVIVLDQAGGRSLIGKEMPVTIKLKDGRTFSKTTTVLKGSGEMPLSKEEIIGKFKNHTQGFLSQDQVKRAADLAFNLEKLDNIAELVNIGTMGQGK